MTLSYRTRRISLSLTTVVLTVATLFIGAPPAQAQSLREQIPMMAGTALSVPGYRQCTVGAVLTKRSAFSMLTPTGRATRYLLIAKHCAPYKGAEIKLDETTIGTVSWLSATYDAELVKVAPSTTQRPICTGASQLHNCFIPSATPRAVGKVILNSGSTQAAVPVPGTGLPAPGERFCTSGSVTFVNCSYEATGVPPEGWDPGELAARTNGRYNVLPGDSGGPVASIGGRLYGIIVQQGHGAHDRHNYQGLMGYLPIDTVLQDLSWTYALAPA
ncbi:hypothetical protein C5D35_10515 [Rathayibacter toxicus]|nr:hypothetical protein C5D35_10515 [Rathayibacter toxicus]